MSRFCVNRNSQSTGEHEVHNLDANCPHLPQPSNRVALGEHSNCRGALAAARKHYANVDGCAFCAPSCHSK